VLTSLLSPSGTIISDPRTSHIIVRDLNENLSKMKETVLKLDVPLQAQVFAVTHVNAETLLESIEILLSERGTIQMDPRTNSLIVTDLPSRQEKIQEVIAILDKQLDTRTWTLKYMDPDDIADRLEELVPEEMGTIVSDADVHQITVTAIPERLDEIDKYIAAWDTKRKQVQIEAFLVEMSSKLARSLNISWSYFDSSGNAPQAYRINGGALPDYAKPSDTITVGQLPYAEYLRNPVTGDVIKDVRGKEIISKFHGSNVAAVIDYLDTHGDATVLSAPRVTVQDGEEASFQNGRQVPYVTSTTYDYGGYGGYNNNNSQNGSYNYGYRPYNRIDFIEVGTILKVLPRITEDSTILLDIIAEDSDATLTKVISNGEENTIPEKTESVAETQVRVADGQTIAIGGLRKSGSSQDVSKSLPVLSDIPVLGNLFKTPSRKISNATLMIFITTTVVDENTQPESEKLADYDQRFAQDLRESKKTSFGRFVDTITRDKDEISISIGQGGYMHYNGNPVTLDDLRKVFKEVKDPALTKIILRRHPRAPEKVVSEIIEAAMEANIKVDFDTTTDAFVPNYESMTKDKPVTSNAMPDERVKPKSPEIPKAVTTPPEPLQDPPAADPPVPPAAPPAEKRSE
jgi:type II secretory pathway component GspD/PulD (secretin)